MRRCVLGVAFVLVTTGCGAARHGGSGRAPQLIAFADYYERHGDFTGTELVRLRPKTLRPYGRPLRLGDAVVTAPTDGRGALSPDRRTLALGGESFGELFLVDLARLRRTARIVAIPGFGGEGGMEIQILSWPRPDRL